MNLRQFLADAFTTASDPPPPPSRDDPADRSVRWVESLAAAFRRHYESDPTVRVFSKFHSKLRPEFGLNEFLYDVSVCRTATCTSPLRGSTLSYVTHALWQIESEFSSSTRQSLFDFNKLVVGAAEKKLFIGPCWRDCNACLATLAKPASHCSGEVLVASVPQPDSWKRLSTRDIKLWRFARGAWEESG